jgi:hypothetical protein
MYSTILPDSIKITITTGSNEVNERKNIVYFQIIIKYTEYHEIHYTHQALFC